jgi:hypothetical protein
MWLRLKVPACGVLRASYRPPIQTYDWLGFACPFLALLVPIVAVLAEGGQVVGSVEQGNVALMWLDVVADGCGFDAPLVSAHAAEWVGT